MKSGIYIQHTPTRPIRFVAVNDDLAVPYDPITRELLPEGFSLRVEENYTFVHSFPMPAVNMWQIERTSLLTLIVKIAYRGSLQVVKLPPSANKCKGVERVENKKTFCSSVYNFGAIPVPIVLQHVSDGEPVKVVDVPVDAWDDTLASINID